MQATENLVDLPRNDQSRQMQHHTDANAGANVRRAGCQIAPPWRKGVWHNFFNLIVYHLDLLPRTAQVEATVHALNTEVVFFVDHQTHLFEYVDGNAAGSLRISMLAANQLPFDQKLTVHFFQVTNIDVFKPTANRQGCQSLA